MKKNIQKYMRVSTEKIQGQDGSAMVVALLVMILLMGFVALAVSRTNSETVAESNDTAESRAFEAAHASLEVMTRNFNKIFDLKLNPDAADLTRVASQKPPVFDTEYDFIQTITPSGTPQPVVMTGELFQGLNALRDEWKLDTMATSKKDGVEVALTRRFFNNRIPIFQFGIFYDDDLEFHPGPRFDFGGRVHSNGNIFLAASTGLYFASKVSAQGQILTNVQKNGKPWSDWDDNVFIKNASGTFIQLQNNMGSALTSPVNGSPVTSNPLPTTYRNASWATHQAKFQGNLLSGQKPLDLPVKLNNNITNPLNALDYVELMKRTKNIGDLWNDRTGTVSSPSIVPVVTATSDDEVTERERYAGKNGMRISLSDSKAKLPGCATSTGAAVTTPCGVRLDGNADGLGLQTTTDRGYQPRAMGGTPAYQATRLNGNRIAIPGREVWIKIETNGYDQPTNTYVTADITEDILSFGVTEAAPSLNSGTNFAIQEPSNYYTSNIDKRSIIKLQRFIIDGADIPSQSSTATVITKNDITWADQSPLKGPYNFVLPAYITGTTTGNCLTASGGSFVGYDNTVNPNIGGAYTDERAHWRRATVRLNAPLDNTTTKCVAPFPINMFDTREGLYFEGTSTFNPTDAANYGDKVPWAGVMSLIDVDVANLRAFLNGSYDTGTTLPTTTLWAVANSRALRSTDIRNANGWVVYVSDRRGDFDFDGEYDMEDVYGNNDGILQPGEDVNKNTTLQGDYTNEAVRYRGSGTSVSPDVAAVFEHKYYRRGVRLINGTTLPGQYNASPGVTQGFTFASENGVYVKGNYNATGVASYGTPTPPSDYLPQNTVNHIPASIAADAVVILSNNWNDARSFVYPFDLNNRPATETTLRFATLTGDTITSLDGDPDQGGGNPRMSGGVHNFIRFLEDWDNSVNLNYSGSLINLFNSRNNTGTFKCCSIIYVPPERNWVFDTSFLDGARLPPGTPFFQVIQLTGFQRLN